MEGQGADELRPITSTLSADELHGARLGFHRASPRRSAKRVFHISQGFWLLALLALLYWASARAPDVTFSALHVIAGVIFAIAIFWRLIAASILTPTLSRLAAPAHWPTYTIL